MVKWLQLRLSRPSWTKCNREAWIKTRNVFTWKRIGVVFLLFIFANCFAYVGQRNEWMGDDNANFEAKEYFVSGQMVYFYRSIASDSIHPSKYPVTFLLDWLQKAIYEEGVKYLPENDGEKGVWLHTWFVYPHSKRFKIPYNHSGTREGYLPIITPYLNDVWLSLKSMAEGEYRDKQMYRQHYLRNFAGAAHYYSLVKYEYVKRGRKVRRRFVKTPYAQRDKLLLQWLRRLPDKWDKIDESKSFIEQHPRVEVMREVTILTTISDIIFKSIWEKSFSCKDPLIYQYAVERRRFATYHNDIKPVIDKMRDRQAAKQLYHVAVNKEIARLMKYVLENYCGYSKIYGQADMKHFTGRGKKDPFEYEIRFLREAIYPEEMKLIEEALND